MPEMNEEELLNDIEMEIQNIEQVFEISEKKKNKINQEEVLPLLKEHLTFHINNGRTYIYMVAMSANRDENKRCTISCSSGKPICTSGYDIGNDSCYINALEVMDLGNVPLVARIAVNGIVNWIANFPLAKEVFEKHLSPDQENRLKNFCNKYAKHKIEFFQLIGC